MSVLADHVKLICVALVAVAEVITGAVGGCVSTLAGFTVTVVTALELPVAFVAVNVYVVVADGVTTFEERPVTLPIPLMLRLVAPDTFHDRVADCPAVTEEGLLVNEDIVGAVPPPGVITESTTPPKSVVQYQP